MTFAIAEYSGSATIGTTEHSLVTNTSGPDVATAAGIYQLIVDFSTLALGDIFEITVYEKAQNSGSTQNAVQTFIISHSQNDANPKFPALSLGIGWDITAKKSAGTDRSLAWSIARVS